MSEAVQTKKQTTYVTTSGDEIRLKPASSKMLEMIKLQVEKEFRDRGEPIDPPTYTVETAGGGQEVHAHDEESITTDEEKEAWAKHQDALKRMSNEASLKTSKYAFLTGIDISIPKETEWYEMQKYFGVDVPEEPNDRKLHYIQTEILRTPADIQNALMEILKMTWDGVDPALIEGAEASFRNKLSPNTDKAGDAS